MTVRAVLPLRPEEASETYNLIAITASSGESIEQAMPINSIPEDGLQNMHDELLMKRRLATDKLCSGAFAN